ncbi:MAG: oligosaccharide flippase family protein [Chloroflexi bacterium]|nr:oligosaccharide flippase family protein [Chloroflexota bacterium]
MPLGLFWSVTVGGRTLIPADNLFNFEPWRSAADQFGVTTPHNELLSDLLLENYAWKRFIVESLRHKEIPLWNPYLFAGVPFLAAGQHSALYPFSIVFYILPLSRAYGVFIVSQFFLAGAFTYLFLRSLRLGRLPALLGAMTYELSLFMVVSVVFPMIVAGAVWLPLFLTGIEWVIVQRPALGRPASLPWLGLGAVALGCAALAGHPEVLYYTLLIGGAYSLWRLFSPPPTPNPRTLVRPVLYLLAIVLIGLGLGGVQLIPLVEAVRGNFRVGSTTFQQILSWGYPPRHLLAFLIPNFFGNPSHHEYFDLFTWQWTPATVNALGQPIQKIDWGIKNFVEGGAYVGLLPLLLSFIALRHWLKETRELRGRETDNRAGELRGLHSAICHPSSAMPGPYVPFFSLLAALSLSFAFGTPLYALVFWLPGINQLHSPFRWVWPFSFCVAVLCAYGGDYLQKTHENWKREEGKSRFPLPSSLFLWASPSLITTLAGIAVWGGALVIAGLIAARIFYDPLATAIERTFFSLALAPQAFADARMFFSYESRQVFIFALLLVCSGIVLRVSRCPIHLPAKLGGRPIWEALALGVLGLDLLAAGGGFNPSADPRILDYTPPVVAFLKHDTSLWRFTTFDPDGRKPFNANVGWFFDLYDVRGYDSIIPKQYAEYMTAIEPQGELQYNRIAPISNLESLNSPLLDLLNVKYVISQLPIANPKYTLVYTDSALRVYRNETVAPRAFTLPWTSAIGSIANVPETFQTHDPRQYVLIDEQADQPPEARNVPTTVAPGGLRPAEVVGHSGNEVTLNAEVDEPSYVILADSFAPGWKAFARPEGTEPDAEHETSVIRVDGNFRGVYLGPGAWTVRFKYSPLSVKVGAFASLMAAMVLVFAVGTWLWRYFYHESAVDSTARRVAKNSLAPMALNLMNRAIDLVFAAFMLRVLGPGDAGKYYFAGVIIIWFDTLAGFGLNTFLTREVARDRTHANRYLSNTTILRLILSGASLLILAGAVLVSQRWLGLANDTALAIVLLAIGLAPGSVSTGLTALFQAYEKHEYPAAITTVTTILKVTFGAAALVIGLGFVGLAGVSILVNTATMLLLGVLAVRLFFIPRFEFDAGVQRSMIRESAPLMINNLLAGLFFKVDVTLLEPIRNARQKGLGSREVGWYSTAYKFVEAYNIVPSLFTFALFPVMARQAVEDRPALLKSYGLAVKLLVFTSLPIAAVTTFLAHLMIGALGGAAFLPDGAWALQLMVWSIPFGWINSVTNYLLIALGQQRALTRAFVIGLTFNIVANLIFIPRYGYPAAAIITIISEIVEGTPFYLALRQSLAPVPWVRLLWKPILSVLVMIAVMIALWPIQPLLALVLGLGVYFGAAVVLRVFDPDEWALFVTVLPGGVRRRLAPAS